jgi:AcrR family transcriptional regulator
MNEPRQQSYHHGNLRAAIVEAALRSLETVGPEELSLRALAAAAGVSRAAPYAHFPDKASLLSAVAEAGFERMADEMIASAEAASDAHSRFLAIGRAYVRFALRNRNLFKLMFSSGLVPAGAGAESQPLSHRPYEILRDALHVLLAENVVQGLDEAVVRTSAWSCVHGLSLLLLEQRLPTTAEGRDTLVEDVTSLFADLLGGRSAGRAG